MSIGKFDKGCCYKETYLIQDFIWKAITDCKGFLTSYSITLTIWPRKNVLENYTSLCLSQAFMRFTRLQYPIPYKNGHTYREGLHRVY